jgi:hypothetical protein
MPTLMSAITQPVAHGITAQARKRQHAGDSGASRNTPLLAPAGMTISLKHELQQVGEGLQQAERADDVGALAQLHRRPDLAVGEQQE